jgi:hypothetical protein
MNCQKFEQVVGELARGRMMEAEVRADALAHSEECEVCLARLRHEEMLTRGLQFLAVDMEALSAPPELELKLREAFRSRKAVMPLATRSTRPRYWWAAVAAVLLVAMMTAAAMWWRSTATPQQEVANEAKPAKALEVPHGPSERPAPKPIEYAAVNELPKPQPATLPKSIHRNMAPRQTPETPMANHVSNEIATDFMPLGDFNPASLQDGGQIVRVKLRRSALVRFGLPMNMDRYNENVKADVLVGVDGLAHAIRFVQ